MKKIPYGRQSISADDIGEVVKVLQGDWLTQGPAIPAFEKAVAGYCGAPYAVAVSNATVALQLAATAMGIGPGKTLWTTPITFVATTNAALCAGGSVDFVDIDPLTRNISVEALQKKLVAAKKNGSLPAVVAPVHFSGLSCDMKELQRLGVEYGFSLLEDACHALGGTYQNERIGSCRYSDTAIFSFHPVKSITSAEGGMILTRSESLRNALLPLRNHGITRDPSRFEKKESEPWYYEQQTLGTNGRISDLHAALGISQLKRLDGFVEKRRTRAKRYYELLEGLPVTLPRYSDESAWHLFVIEVAPTLRNEVVSALRANSIEANVHYIPVHLQPYYRKLGFKAGQFPLAEKYYSGAITLPLYPDLTDADQEAIAQTLRKILQ